VCLLGSGALSLQPILLHQLGLPLRLFCSTQRPVHGLPALGWGGAAAAQQVGVNVVHFFAVADLQELSKFCDALLSCALVWDSLDLQTRPRQNRRAGTGFSQQRVESVNCSN